MAAEGLDRKRGCRRKGGYRRGGRKGGRKGGLQQRSLRRQIRDTKKRKGERRYWRSGRESEGFFGGSFEKDLWAEHLRKRKE